MQALPSLHDAVLFALTQPVDGLHESFVQTLLSLQLGAGPPTQSAARARVRRRAGVAVVAGRRVVRVDAAGRRVARVVRADVAVVAVRRRAADAGAAAHVSAVVQALPSLHDAVLFVLTQPVAGLHESFVQTLPSLQLGAGPPTQRPPAHVSVVVQALPSLQDAVLFVLTQPVAGLHESSVQTLLSLQLSAGPPTQSAARAGVRRRAGVAVVARRRVVRVDAAGRRVARVVRAHVAVVAVGRRAADAEAARAGVGRRAGVPVVAGGGVVRVDAAGRRVARVVGADVAVVAVRRRAADAGAAARTCRPSCRRCRRCRTPCCSC